MKKSIYPHVKFKTDMYAYYERFHTATESAVFSDGKINVSEDTHTQFIADRLHAPLKWRSPDDVVCKRYDENLLKSECDGVIHHESEERLLYVSQIFNLFSGCGIAIDEQILDEIWSWSLSKVSKFSNETVTRSLSHLLMSACESDHGNIRQRVNEYIKRPELMRIVSAPTCILAAAICSTDDAKDSMIGFIDECLCMCNDEEMGLTVKNIIDIKFAVAMLSRNLGKDKIQTIWSSKAKLFLNTVIFPELIHETRPPLVYTDDITSSQWRDKTMFEIATAMKSTGIIHDVTLTRFGHTHFHLTSPHEKRVYVYGVPGHEVYYNKRFNWTAAQQWRHIVVENLGWTVIKLFHVDEWPQTLSAQQHKIESIIANIK